MRNLHTFRNRAENRNSHAGYCMLAFMERDLPDSMDLLKKMDNLNWEKTRNCSGFHMSLHMMDEKLKLNKEKMKQIYGKRLKFKIHGIGF